MNPAEHEVDQAVFGVLPGEVELAVGVVHTVRNKCVAQVIPAEREVMHPLRPKHVFEHVVTVGAVQQAFAGAASHRERVRDVHVKVVLDGREDLDAKGVGVDHIRSDVSAHDVSRPPHVKRTDQARSEGVGVAQREGLNSVIENLILRIQQIAGEDTCLREMRKVIASENGLLGVRSPVNPADELILILG